MKTIPSEITEIFNQRLGVESYYVIKIDWEDGPLLYGLQEYTTELGPVYAYVKEVVNSGSKIRYDGFGVQNQISVLFFDTMGHFKEKLDSVDLFNRLKAPCSIYLGAIGTEKLLKIFDGYIHDPIVWDEDDRVLSIDIVERPLEKEIGYAPKFEDIDPSTPGYTYFEDNLTGDPWPQVFGKVKNMPVPLFCRTPEVTVTSDVPYHSGATPYFFPVSEPCPFPLNTTLEVRLVGSDQGTFELKAIGQFVEHGGGIAFTTTNNNVTSNFYEDLPATITPSGGVPGFRYNKLTITDWIGNGRPWLKNMHLQLQATLGGSALSLRWVNCIDQDENTITINVATLRAGIFSDSPVEWPTYVIKRATKSLQPVKNIRSGTIIRLASWEKRNIFVVDTKEGTEVSAVRYRSADGLTTVPSWMYDIFTTDGSDSNRLFNNGHPPCTYIKFTDDAFLSEAYSEKFGRSIQSSQVEVIVNADNDLNNDYDIIDYLMDPVETHELPVQYRDSMNFALFTLEDLQDIVPEIAYQAAKFVRFRDGKAEIVPVGFQPEPVFTFNDSNVLMGSVKLTSSTLSDIITQFNVTVQTNDYEVEPIVKTFKVNVEKYGQNENGIDFYVFDNKASANAYFQFWRERLSNPWCKIQLTAFMDSFAVDVLDTVTVDLGLVRFYDSAKGTPLKNILQGAIEQGLWSGVGLVEEISPRLDEGLIDFLIMLPVKLGEQ